MKENEIANPLPACRQGRRLILAIIFLPLFSHSQISDDFSDGNFTKNPSWNGSQNKFIINSSYQLQLNDSIAGDSYLSVSCPLASLDNIEWRFFIRQNFSSSGNNNSRIYIASDSANLNASVNGYFIQFGEAGSLDAIELFRQQGTALTTIARGTNSLIANAFALAVKITRDNSGLWTISTDIMGGNNFQVEATGIDNKITTSSFFGVQCNYTLSNATKFYFDNFFIGSPIADTLTHYVAHQHDVVINEIMADPSPSAGLPENEYIEIFNATSRLIKLDKWSISAGTHTKIIAGGIILPDSFLLLTSLEGAMALDSSIAKIGIPGFPALLNAGQTLTLKSPQGSIISTVAYSDTWYQNGNKKKGGWSLEQIDPSNPCAGINNWTASSSNKGGTPGFKNSVLGYNPDQNPPELIRVNVLAADTIELYFNESLDSCSVLDSTIYTIDHDIGLPVEIDPVAPDFQKLKLILGLQLQLGIIYTITVKNNILDCAGNFSGNFYTANFALPEPCLKDDLVINEVLFDPKIDGVDFVEIYNKSNKVINLKKLFLSSFDSMTNSLTDIHPISNEGYLLFPSEYLVLSEGAMALKRQYYTHNPKGFIDLADMPVLKVDQGTIVLSDIGATIIDLFTYTSSMHFPLLNDTKGISLERIDFNRETNDKTNWHSAAGIAGFATPAYENSQYHHSRETNETIHVSPEIFSPDNDGFNDVVTINYIFNSPGFTANVIIYDAKGRLVRRLLRNELIGVKGEFSWDGITDNIEKASIGIYVIYIEVFSLDGKVESFKKTCVLGAKL